MRTLIKTENVPNFIKEHFPNAEEFEMRRDYGDLLKKDIIVANTNNIPLGEGLIIELESRPNSRCKLIESFHYDLKPYDSISARGTLISYNAEAYELPSQH